MTEEQKRRFDAVLDGIKLLGLFAGGIWVLVSYNFDLRKPFYEKQLELYLDATRTVAGLTTATSTAEKAPLEARFWQLYWGELALVESPFDPDAPTVEGYMAAFCKVYFAGDARCNAAGDPVRMAAFELAHQARNDVQRRWAWW